jgi:YesN/AraC family two-component response regulator
MATKVVIVDDAGFICELLKSICESLGLQVIGEASNGEEGISLCIQMKPDLVFMDLVMPRMNGSEAIFKIRERNLPVKVIACSTLEEARPPLNEMKIPFDFFLAKPFTKETVKQAVQEALRG